MKPTAESLLLILISAALAMASLIGHFRLFDATAVEVMSHYKYLLMAAGYGVLSLSLILRDQPPPHQP